MRDRAAEAVPGPWECVYDGYWSEVSIRVADSDPNMYIEVALTHQRPDSDEPSPTAEHIASWHPAVAQAIAGWLESEATVQNSFEKGQQDLRPANPMAFRVARLYLGLED